MKKIVKERLNELGISVERYTIEHPDFPTVVERWGIELDGPNGKMVVEYQTDEYGGKPRYYLRKERGSDEAISIRKRQADAIVDYIRLVYSL